MRQAEAGIALLISIFILLLISVVAIALIVSSGTESALAGNYRSSTSVYYDALAGLEEARGRLPGVGPSAFRTTDPTTFLPLAGTCLSMGNTYYLINPVSGEVITPWDSASTYPDNQFFKEFSVSGFTAPTNPSPTAPSIWNRAALNPGNYPGPLYKWVRINAVSEQSLNVDADADTHADATTPLYYDGTHFRNTGVCSEQVIELTAYALLPNGSQKLLQYIVAPAPIILPPFLAALTLSGSPGNSPVFHAPLNNAFYAVKGDDYNCSWNPSGLPSQDAIGLFGDYSGSSYSSDLTAIVSGIPTNASGTNTRPNYTGQVAAPDVQYLTAFPANLQSPSQIDAVAQNIIQNAVSVTVPAGSAATQQAFLNSLAMSPSNLMTVIVKGDLDLTSWTGTGYGLLLVTGTLIYDPAATWNGIVLVIGQGKITNIDHGEYQQLNGAVFVAKTRDTSGTLLTGRIGGASVSFDPPMQGNGIRYSSCWIPRAQPFSGYKILSYHEIAQ